MIFSHSTSTTSSSTASSPSSSPSFFSDELPTPRSSTESRVSEALLLHNTNDELLELRSCIKPEPMSQTRLPHSTPPSLDIQSPSGRHEDVVEDAMEAVKVGLERLHPGAVQEYRRIGTQSLQENYKTTLPSPLPKYLPVDHPNPRPSPSKPPLIASALRKSPTINKAVEGDHVASAKAGIKVVQPNEERLIILRLTNILGIHSDQTVIQELENVDLDRLPEVERFLESSRVRYDYDSTSHSLFITMASPPHECGGRAMRRIFEPVMDALTAKYGGSWKYDTNARIRICRNVDDRVVLTSSTRTPDGAISDKDLGILLAGEVSASQDVEVARTKIQSFFCSPSVVAGIIINLDENPVYESPKQLGDWADRSFVTLAEWNRMQSNEWGPMYFGGHCWGGKYRCQMEVHWPCTDGKQNSFSASLVPLGPKEDLESINDELIEVMKALAAKHFEDHVDPNDLDSFLATPLLDIESFRRSLSEDLCEAAYHRYSKAWTCANGEPTIGSSTQVDERNKHFAAAAELRREARLHK